MIPNVILGYHSRPMCCGLQFRDAFRQAGCRVWTAGPSTPTVYGMSDGSVEHTFDENDFVPSNFVYPNEPVPVQEVIDTAKSDGIDVDLVVMIDQYDHFYLTGGASVPFANVCVENWGELYASRYTQIEADYWYYMICHSQTIPFPEEFTWLPFGADPFIHPYMPEVERDKLVCQIGSAYEPRPELWDKLRNMLDGVGQPDGQNYRDHLIESPSTLFGRTPSYRKMAIAYNRSLTALSASNVDFSPMRTVEAFAMGCILISDDVPAIRAVAGPPKSEGGFWVAHNYTAESVAAAIREVADDPEWYAQARDRAIAYAFKGYLYKHRAEQILRAAGISGACRMI